MRVLVVADIRSWAYWRRAKALQAYSPRDIEVTICVWKETPWQRVKEGAYDLIYLIDYSLVSWARTQVNHTPEGKRPPLVCSYNVDPGRHQERWNTCRSHADFLVVNNRLMWDFKKRPRKTCCISNGVDTKLWVRQPFTDRSKGVIWCGSSHPDKKKNYKQVLVPLEAMLRDVGWDPEFRPVNSPDQFWPQDRMLDWYNHSRYVVCAASAEGTPNYLLESMACGCVPVSTMVGNTPEWMVDGQNGVVCEPRAESVFEAIRRAEGLGWTMLSHNAEQTIRNSWGYDKRARVFYSLWRQVLDNGAMSIDPFDWLSVQDQLGPDGRILLSSRTLNEEGGSG